MHTMESDHKVLKHECIMVHWGLLMNASHFPARSDHKVLEHECIMVRWVLHMNTSHFPASIPAK